MRKITNDSVRAFLNGRTFSRGNMSTDSYEGARGRVASLYLHGNLIATKIGCGQDYDLEIRDAGWESNTTKERLNGVLDMIGAPVGIYQQNHEWFIGGEFWTGSAIVHVRDGAVTHITTPHSRTREPIVIWRAAA